MTETFFHEVLITGMGLAAPGLGDPPGAAADRWMRGLAEPTARMLARCARMALEQARLPGTGRLGPRFGVAAGVTLAAVDSIMDLDLAALRFGLVGVRPLAFPNTVLNAPAGRLAIAFGITGPNATLASAESGGLDAVIYARDMIWQGRAAGFVAGAAWAGSERVESAIGEKETVAGGAMFVVEAAPAARSRGALGLARVGGAGMAFLPCGAPKEEIAARALAEVLREAELEAGEIAVVVTATAQNTPRAALERAVLERVLGSDAAASARLAGAGRRLLDAAGCLALAAALSTLRRTPSGHVLLTSFSSFGHASFLLLCRPDWRWACGCAQDKRVAAGGCWPGRRGVGHG